MIKRGHQGALPAAGATTDLNLFPQEFKEHVAVWQVVAGQVEAGLQG